MMVLIKKVYEIYSGFNSEKLLMVGLKTYFMKKSFFFRLNGAVKRFFWKSSIFWWFPSGFWCGERHFIVRQNHSANVRSR
jgi:hypothetical protein